MESEKSGHTGHKWIISLRINRFAVPRGGHKFLRFWKVGHAKSIDWYWIWLI